MADFTSIRREECRATPLPPGCSLGASRTVILQSVLNEIKEHGRASMHAEVCGVLVGSLCWDGAAYLLVDGRIEGKHATHQSGSVTFTAETWDSIHEELDAKHPGRVIVGWYHTHPGFGIFLSNMDAFIHENFFSFPWQPAYVFDPQAETDGFFFREGNNLVQEEVAVVPDAAPLVREPTPCTGDRIVVQDESGRSFLRIGLVGATVLLLLLGTISASSILLLRQSRQRERLAEEKAERLQQTIRNQAEELREFQRQREAEQASHWLGSGFAHHLFHWWNSERDVPARQRANGWKSLEFRFGESPVPGKTSPNPSSVDERWELDAAEHSSTRQQDKPSPPGRDDQ